MWIINARSKKDFARLNMRAWLRAFVGTDEFGEYYIAGGNKNSSFKAIAIEFYGVKTQM